MGFSRKEYQSGLPFPSPAQNTSGKKGEAATDFILLGSKVTTDGDCSHEITRPLLLGRKAMTNLDSVLKKQRYHFADKRLYSQSCGFPIVTNGCESWTIKGWTLKNWCFQTVVLEKTLESPFDCKKIKPVNPKGNQPEYSLEGLMLRLKF